jgi:hypothetical protein
MKAFTPDTSVYAPSTHVGDSPVTVPAETHGQAAVTPSVFWYTDGSVEISTEYYSVTHLRSGMRCGHNDLTLDVARRYADALAEIDLDALAELPDEQRPVALIERGQELEYLAWAESEG